MFHGERKLVSQRAVGRDPVHISSVAPVVPTPN